VVGETFLRAWRSADRYDPALGPNLRVWLFAIARNATIYRARAARARPWQRNLVDPPTVEAASGTIDDPTDRLLRSWVVEEALQRISPEHRAALVETHLKERPYADVAAFVAGDRPVEDLPPAAQPFEQVDVRSDVAGVSAAAGIVPHTSGVEIKLVATGFEPGSPAWSR
jgi:hypothetical protein